MRRRGRLLLAGEPPSLAILDWMMPTLGIGPELCRRIRANAATAPMMRDASHVAEARDRISWPASAGADDYLVKPFDLGELRARVSSGCVATLQERLADRVSELQARPRERQATERPSPTSAATASASGPTKDYSGNKCDSYVAHHSEAQFSHGICPTCYTKVMEELDEAEAQKRGPKR